MRLSRSWRSLRPTARATGASSSDSDAQQKVPSRSPGRKVYPTCAKKRDRAQFVSFNFQKSTDLHGHVKRSFAPATQAGETRCASVAGPIEGARAALQGCAVLAALLAKGWRGWGLPSGAERKPNAHSGHFGSFTRNGSRQVRYAIDNDTDLSHFFRGGYDLPLAPFGVR
jgi:hypothetical protein